MGASSLLVTGASGVIGSSLVAHLASDQEWSDCVLVAQGRAAAAPGSLVRAWTGRELRWVGGDLGDRSTATALLKAVEEAGPWLGAALVAGQNHDRPLARLDAGLWDQVWNANMKGHAALLRGLAALPKRESAAAVLVSSVVGVRGNAGQIAYAAAKGAIVDLARSGLPFRVNVLLPPLVESPLLAGLSGEARENLFSARLLPDPESRVTAAAHGAFLLSRRSSYIHGAVWHADSRISGLPWQGLR